MAKANQKMSDALYLPLSARSNSARLFISTSLPMGHASATTLAEQIEATVNAGANMPSNNLAEESARTDARAQFTIKMMVDRWGFEPQTS
jgi:hypothetical protein